MNHNYNRICVCINCLKARLNDSKGESEKLKTIKTVNGLIKLYSLGLKQGFLREPPTLKKIRVNSGEMKNKINMYGELIK